MTETIDPRRWQEALQPLTKELYRAWSDRDWTWTTGGCFAFAAAFQAAYGGEFYGVCVPDPLGSGDYPVEHALVKLDGVFYDYDGVFDPKSVKPPRCIKARSDPDVFWFEDDYLDDEEWEAMHEALEESRGTHPSADASKPR